MDEYTQTTIGQELDSFPCKVDIKIHWSEMDAARHVNNTGYLRWAEMARIELFYQLKIGRGDANRNIGMILGWQDCKYIFPVTFPDTVSIGVRVTDVGSDRFMLQCHHYSQRHARLVAISNHRIVAYDYQALAKVELPDDWRQRLTEVL